MAPQTLDSSKIRTNFPAFKKYPGFIFGDNAGGSQILQDAADRIMDYLVNTNIQMGSDYMPTSTERCMKLAQADAVQLFNAASPDEIVFGASSTQNIENLARGLEDDIKPGDEIIVTWEHEANAGPWKRLARRKGAVLKTWEPTQTLKENPFSFSLRVEDLLPLISSKTRLVAFTACSNILGSILPVQDIVKVARADAAQKGATKLEICLDCVAYAPHRKMDVQTWDVDFAVFSYYKVYGPHIGALYVRKTVLTSSVKPIVHHFLSPGYDNTGYKLQPAGPGYESVWGATAVVPYLKSLTPSCTLQGAFEAMSAHDAELAGLLLRYLAHDSQWKRGVRVVGDVMPGADRMPTVSFVVVQGQNGEKALGSRQIIQEFDKHGKIGIRYGHFYAYSLVSAVRPDDPHDGVVRISFVHYNTEDEVSDVIATLGNILSVS